MYGAHIRYNCQIQEKRGTRQLQKEFEAIWDEWKADLTSFPWDRWDTAFLWQLAKLHTRQVKDYTIEFVEAWIDGIHGAATTEKLDALVTRQERLNKKARARLHPTADISESNWVGIGDLNYRLNVARTIISDIDDGLTHRRPTMLDVKKHQLDYGAMLIPPRGYRLSKACEGSVPTRFL